MSDYYSDLDKIKAAGRKYAENCIAAGETEPLDSPFSGEWADGLTGQDVLNAAGIKATFADLDDFDQTDVLDSWETGYLSAPWPNEPWYGACGVMHCDDCLPRFDADNRQLDD